MEKNELKKLLLEGTEKLIAQLSEILDKNSGLYNEMIILSKKYYEGKMEINLGTIKFEDWNILKAQVDVGLLDLIDRIQKPVVHEKKQNTKQKNIIVEDTIKRLSNLLLEQVVSFSKEEKEYDGNVNITSVSYRINKVNINEEGDFNITNTHKFRKLRREIDGCINVYYLLSEKIDVFVNLSDITEISVVKDGNQDFYHIELKSYKNQKCFSVKTERTTHDDNPNRESAVINLEIKDENRFSFRVEYLDLANSIKNAFDYLAVHFGRKENAF